MDDFYYGEIEEFLQGGIGRMKKKKIAESRTESTSFKYIGVMIKQEAEKLCRPTDQRRYIDTLRELEGKRITGFRMLNSKELAEYASIGFHYILCQNCLMM